MSNDPELRPESGSDPTTEAELRAALDELLVRAHANGVKLDQPNPLTFQSRHDDPNTPDWEIVITPVSKPRYTP